MKNFKKIIFLALVGIAVFSMTTSLVWAKTLRERDEEARAKYQAARQQYLKEVNWWRNTREQFLNARARYRQFRNTENKALYEEKAREFLEKTVDVLIKKLEALRNWISNRRAISETERQAIVAEINEDINWLQEKKSGIATATPAQIKEKAREIRNYWLNHRVKVKKIIGQIWGARLDWVIEKFESIAIKISAKIDELKAEGKDTSRLEMWLADFNEKIEIAKEKREKAREKYEAISSLADANQLFKQAHQFIKEANQYLREAHKKLIEIVKEMRKIATAMETIE